SHNEAQQGGQSIIYMGGGVRHGQVFGNVGWDVYYDWIRAYRQVLGVDIFDNTMTVRPGTYAGMTWVTEGTKSHRLGIRIGHNSSAVGSCKDINVRNNTLRLLDDDWPVAAGSAAQDQTLINVSTGCE